MSGSSWQMLQVATCFSMKEIIRAGAIVSSLTLMYQDFTSLISRSHCISVLWRIRVEVEKLCGPKRNPWRFIYRKWREYNKKLFSRSILISIMLDFVGKQWKWSGHWWLSRTSNPVWRVNSLSGGFDSHALPPCSRVMPFAGLPPPFLSLPRPSLSLFCPFPGRQDKNIEIIWQTYRYLVLGPKFPCHVHRTTLKG